MFKSYSKWGLAFIAIGVFIWAFASYKNVPDNILKIAFIGSKHNPSILNSVNLYLKQHRDDLDNIYIQIETYDDEHDIEFAQKNARIISNSDAIAVIGHGQSSHSITAGRIYKQHGIVAISPTSTHVNVTNNNPWYFQTIFNDHFQGKYMAVYGQKVLKKKTAIIIHENQEYGAYLASIIHKTATSMGTRIPLVIEYNANDSNIGIQVKTQLESLKRLITQRSDDVIIYLNGHQRDAIHIVKAIRDMGISSMIFGSDALSQKSFVNELSDASNQHIDYTENIVISSPLLYDSANAMAIKYKQEYIDQYDSEPDWHGAFTYDSMAIILSAIKSLPESIYNQSIATQREQIQQALQSISQSSKAILGATGVTYFDKQGNTEKPIFVGMIKNNQLISAPIQLRQSTKRRPIMINGKSFETTHIVYTGIHFNSIKRLSVDSGTVDLDFIMWFKTKGKGILPSDIKFKNVESEPLVSRLEKQAYDDYYYEKVNVSGTFKISAFDEQPEFGAQFIGIEFQHNSLDQTKVVYVVDQENDQSEKSIEDQIIANIDLENAMSSIKEWVPKSVYFMSDITSVSRHGRSEFDDQKEHIFSKMSIMLEVSKNKLSIRRVLKPNELFELKIIAVILILLWIKGIRDKYFKGYSVFMVIVNKFN